MDSRYEVWITQNVHEAYGQCEKVTASMLEAFPELTRVRGHYQCPVWGERAHWWLTAPDGSIVDPTVMQFPSRGCGDYEPWDDSKELPTGKCMNCGGYAYRSESSCGSQRCKSELSAYYGCEF